MESQATVPITLLRHAQTEFNRSGVDERDCGITDEGVSQAQKLEGHYDLVLLSPMRRCRETLRHSRITYDDIRILEPLREHKKDLCDFLEGEEVVMETEDDVRERVKEVNKILATLPGIRILVVSHGDLLWQLTAKVGDDGEHYGEWLHNAEPYEWRNEKVEGVN